MKTKTIITVLLFAIILVSCAPAVTTVPTETVAPAVAAISIETVIPTSTFTPVPTPTLTLAPPTSTITPTPQPENIADAKDLPVWINRFVRTYNGKIAIDGLELDVNQLTDEILKNDDKFTVLKKVNQTETFFLVINGTPLAIREGNGQWREITPSIISSIYGIKFGYGGLLIGKDADKYYFHKFTDNEKRAQIENSSIFVPGWGFANSTIMWPTLKEYGGTGDPGDWKRWNWEVPDSFFFALSKYDNEYENKTIRGGHIFWDGPDWYMSTALSAIRDEVLRTHDSQKQQQLKNAFLLYTEKTIQRYPQVDQWLVINEVLDNQGLIKQDAWMESLGGEDFLVELLKTAQASNPKAQFMVNDFFVEFPGKKADGYYDMVKRLYDKGALRSSDIVGFQFHTSVRDPHFSDLAKAKSQLFNNWKRFVELGLKISITELDVSANNSQSEIENQAKIYGAIIETVIQLQSEYPESVDSVVTWGYSDDTSWLRNQVVENGGNEPDLHPLLWRDINTPNPSFYEIMRVLYEQLP